jgi:hypothetical protein
LNGQNFGGPKFGGFLYDQIHLVTAAHGLGQYDMQSGAYRSHAGLQVAKYDAFAGNLINSGIQSIADAVKYLHCVIYPQSQNSACMVGSGGGQLEVCA